eukprot:TRINITY_DN825_c0_g1_i2.p1 TRINITY_DN825_c0_g1~~TRINITY_DN825_c0_g1_i2.p1  ORF type:complete len:423 (+),score=167.28 TRINITY_DN825_c0_g1_i2:119-1387(+)
MESSGKYPDFVAYHFLNASGEMMAMEEDGGSTEKFLKLGLNVDGSSIKGMSKVEKSDLRVMPEKETFATIKIGDFVHHRFMCYSNGEDGKPHPRDPRGIFKRLIDKCRAMGFEPYMFSEIEFHIVDEKTGRLDRAGYCSLPPEDESYEFRHELGRLCKELGMKVRRIHHENGDGQNEIELDFTPCMKNADDSLLCMWIMRLLAAKRGQKIIFSPKPYKDAAGNGLHHHILLRDVKTGANVFMNPDFKGDVKNPADDMQRLSEICKYGIAGLLKYADDITAVFAASHETFIRLQPGFEAPINKAWDFSNRTALVRVPRTSIEMTRFEYRGGDLSGSIHMYGAVLLAAVLKGIEEKLPLPPNANFNVEHMSPEELAKHNIMPVPLSFAKCIKVLKSSEFLKECIGPEMVEYLIERDEAAQKESP